MTDNKFLADEELNDNELNSVIGGKGMVELYPPFNEYDYVIEERERERNKYRD